MGEGKGRLRRTISSWANSTDQHARDLRKTYADSGCCSISEAPDRERVRLQGSLRTVTLRARGGVPALEGRIGVQDKNRVMFNPRYELKS
jgi:hypothetical protein